MKIRFLVLAILSLSLVMATSCSSECENPPVCKFNKGDDVQIKSSRWAKKGSVVNVYVNENCDCICEVGQTTWLEGHTTREFTEYELEDDGNGLDDDAVDILKMITK